MQKQLEELKEKGNYKKLRGNKNQAWEQSKEDSPFNDDKNIGRKISKHNAHPSQLLQISLDMTDNNDESSTDNLIRNNH